MELINIISKLYIPLYNFYNSIIIDSAFPDNTGRILIKPLYKVSDTNNIIKCIYIYRYTYIVIYKIGNI